MNFERIITLGCVGLLAVMIPGAKADMWNQKTQFTFGAPVEVPGQVLKPGTYVFKLAEDQTSRSIVEVFNKNESHLYGMFLTVPDYHIRPAERSLLTFEERAEGAPRAVKSWFYPGFNYGHEFLYGNAVAMATTAANHPPAPPAAITESATNSEPATTSEPATEPAQSEGNLNAEAPTNTAPAPPAEVAQATPPPAPPADNAAPNPAPAPQNLPKTASTLPLTGLIGLISLGGAGLFRRLARATEKQ